MKLLRYGPPGAEKPALLAKDGTIRCLRESDPDHICTTKLLWTRVRGAIVDTLRETTLAELVPATEQKVVVA